MDENAKNQVLSQLNGTFQKRPKNENPILYTLLKEGHVENKLTVTGMLWKSKVHTRDNVHTICSEEGVAKRKPMELSFRVALEDGKITTPEGIFSFAKGDYIMYGKCKEIYCIKKDIFPHLYDIV